METIIGQTAPGTEGLIKDTDEAHFADDVLLASREVPVIVDFWAPWCGPCKQLTPLLEKLVTGAGGKVKMVKVNIDENQVIAQQMRVQSIPAVFAFSQGQPVDGFIGAQPESRVRALIERLAGGELVASPAEQALEAGRAALEAGDLRGAGELFGAALQEDPGSAAAIAGLARCHLALGDPDAAQATLDTVAPEKASDADVTAARAELDLARQTAGGGEDLQRLRARVGANPDDHQARYDLALALFGAGQREAAMDELLAIVQKSRAWNDEEARKQLVKFFEILGHQDPLTVETRRRLSSILFS